VKKLSTHSTSSPRSSNRSHKWEPMNPAPPVTRTRRLLNIIASPLFQIYNIVAGRCSISSPYIAAGHVTCNVNMIENVRPSAREASNRPDPTNCLLRLSLAHCLPFAAWCDRNCLGAWKTMRFAGTCAVLISLAGGDAASAQALSVPGNNTRPIVGTSSPQLPNQSRFLSENPATATKVHKDPSGKPCLIASGSSRRQTINPKIFEHIVSFQNHCLHAIKLKVCYYGAETCVWVDVPSYGQKETVLGIYPSLPDFRYQYLEQF
jgi:hypothetical protein